MYIENMLKNYKCALTQKLFSRDFFPKKIIKIYKVDKNKYSINSMEWI